MDKGFFRTPKGNKFRSTDELKDDTAINSWRKAKKTKKFLIDEKLDIVYKVVVEGTSVIDMAK